MKLETLAFVNESWPNTKVNNSVFCRKGRREGGGSVWAAEATVAGTTPLHTVPHATPTTQQLSDRASRVFRLKNLRDHARVKNWNNSTTAEWGRIIFSHPENQSAGGLWFQLLHFEIKLIHIEDLFQLWGTLENPILSWVEHERRRMSLPERALVREWGVDEVQTFLQQVDVKSRCLGWSPYTGKDVVYILVR